MEERKDLNPPQSDLRMKPLRRNGLGVDLKWVLTNISILMRIYYISKYFVLVNP